MPVALGADSCGYAALAAGLLLHPVTLGGADAGALDIAHHADADGAARGPVARLLFRKEPLVADQRQRPIENRRVVAAVVGQRGEVLVQDAVVVREAVRRDQVAPADRDPDDAEV